MYHVSLTWIFKKIFGKKDTISTLTSLNTPYLIYQFDVGYICAMRSNNSGHTLTENKSTKNILCTGSYQQGFFCWPYNFARICKIKIQNKIFSKISRKKNPMNSVSILVCIFFFDNNKDFSWIDISNCNKIIMPNKNILSKLTLLAMCSQFRPNWDKNYKIRLLQLHICRCKFFWTWNLKNVRIVVLAKKFEEESYSQRTKSKASGKKVQNDNF